MKAIAACGYFTFSWSVLLICMHDVIKFKIRTLNVYLIVFGKKTLEIIFISDYQAHGLLLQILSMTLLDTFPNTVHIMLN